MFERPEAPPGDDDRLSAPLPDDSGYTDAEEAEVRKRLADLGYLE
jgi:hypothetical protein